MTIKKKIIIIFIINIVFFLKKEIMTIIKLVDLLKVFKPTFLTNTYLYMMIFKKIIIFIINFVFFFKERNNDDN